jgi:aminoglycoside 6'-N-acetyltransferase I
VLATLVARRDVRCCVELRIVRCVTADPRWVDCRAQLWPDVSHAAHHLELAKLLEARTPVVGLLAFVADRPVGFAEAALRSDPVNGCETSPVAFLEGIWVAASHRRRGVARRLIAAVEEWARGIGCAEFASDAASDNAASHAVHLAAGFEETERVVYFRKRLSEASGTSPTA